MNPSFSLGPLTLVASRAQIDEWLAGDIPQLVYARGLVEARSEEGWRYAGALAQAGTVGLTSRRVGQVGRMIEWIMQRRVLRQAQDERGSFLVLRDELSTGSISPQDERGLSRRTFVERDMGALYDHLRSLGPVGSIVTVQSNTRLARVLRLRNRDRAAYLFRALKSARRIEIICDGRAPGTQRQVRVLI
jgi:hypothetical protein